MVLVAGGRLRRFVQRIGGRGGSTTVARAGAARRIGGHESFEIRYEPDLDGDADPGEVVWGWVPFEEDPTQGKDRPLAVIGRRGGRLVAVPLTSRRDDRDPQVAVGTGAWDRERRPSYARVDRVLDIGPGDVRREGSILPKDRFDDVVGAVRARYRVVG
jgi:hypothetical protein